MRKYREDLYWVGMVLLNKNVDKIENDMDSLYLAHDRESGSVNSNELPVP